MKVTRKCLYLKWLIFLVFLWQMLLIAATVYDLLIGIDVTPDEIGIGEKNGTTIPRLIHQMWKTKDLSSYPIPHSNVLWKTYYPTYEIKLWTDADIEHLFATLPNGNLHSVYKSYLYPIQRADLARLVVLYAYGGIYVDLDVFPSRGNLDDLREKNISFLIGRSATDLCLVNHFLIAEKSSPILKDLLNEIQVKSYFKQIYLLPYLEVFSTGSIFLTKFLRKRLRSIHPAADRLIILSKSTLSKYVFHDAGRSWHLFDGYLINKIDAYPYRFLSLLIVLFALCFGLKRKLGK